jgi:2-polyprenyl-3-methyl-5-hydroxy-6-metoxy-1,4-benzoquinol methylase
VADIQRLEQFRDGEFDTVISCETIEHVPNPPLAIRQLARVLRPGGRLLVTTPNYFSSIGLYRAYCWARGKKFDECGQPIVQWTMIHRVRGWIKAAKLCICLSDSIGQYLPVPGRPPIRVALLEHPRVIMRWLGHHSIVVAEKPGGRAGCGS